MRSEIFFFNYYCFSVWVCWVWFLLRSAVWAGHLLYCFFVSFVLSFLFIFFAVRSVSPGCSGATVTPPSPSSVFTVCGSDKAECPPASSLKLWLLFLSLIQLILGEFSSQCVCFLDSLNEAFSKTKTNKNKALHVGYLLCFCHCWVLC